MKIRTRYAPSPTGRMHVGNLRTALYAYLIAKHEGDDGTFILRIEDTDQGRFVEGATEIIYRTLEETGLIHDEGPDKDKGYGPYVQSERMKAGIYMEYAKKLVEKGEAYYCFCDQERLDSLKREVNGEMIMTYDKHCLGLSDEIYGDITVDNSELDDMVLIKSDGFPTYNFANVVDDHLMEITHVVRGQEYLSSSPKYNRLYEAFGWDVPVYVHCPTITNEQHQKLSKRSGHASFEDLIEQGFVTEAVVNFVALLGWSPEEEREIFSLKELAKAFNYKRISKSPAVFDMVKLRWMNGEYLKAMDPERFYTLAEPYLKKYVTAPLDLRKIAEMVRTRIEIFPDIEEMVDFFNAVPEYDAELYVNKKSKSTKESAAKVLTDVLPLLEKVDDAAAGDAAVSGWNGAALFELLKAYAAEQGFKVNLVMWAVRIALSGKAMTPAGATDILDVLGKEESLKRIRAGIEKLG